MTRFHYTNVVHPKQVIITGMTRDGRGGRPRGRTVRNLRFSAGLPGGTGGGGGGQPRALEGFLGASPVPALRLGVLLHRRHNSARLKRTMSTETIEQVDDAITVEGGADPRPAGVWAIPSSWPCFGSQILSQVGGNMVLFGLTVE